MLGMSRHTFVAMALRYKATPEALRMPTVMIITATEQVLARITNPTTPQPKNIVLHGIHHIDQAIDGNNK